MKITKKSPIKKFIGLSFSVGACNLECSYCYVGRHGSLKEIPYSLDEIKRAFSRRRLRGTAFINICSDGEPLIHPMMVDIIQAFLEQGHYVMVLTNGTLTERLKELLEIPDELLPRLFLKSVFIMRSW